MLGLLSDCRNLTLWSWNMSFLRYTFLPLLDTLILDRCRVSSLSVLYFLWALAFFIRISLVHPPISPLKLELLTNDLTILAWLTKCIQLFVQSRLSFSFLVCLWLDLGWLFFFLFLIAFISIILIQFLQVHESSLCSITIIYSLQYTYSLALFTPWLWRSL